MTSFNFTNEQQEFSNLYYSFGIDYLNKMTQNGVCRGTFIGVPGLQEDELSDFVLKMFCKFAVTNKPMLTEEEVKLKKKPLLLYITLKNKIPDILRNMYHYLKMDERVSLTLDQVNKLDHKTISEYVLSRLTATGFEIKFCQFDTVEGSYLTLIGYFDELESMGYKLQFTALNRIFLLQNTQVNKQRYGFDKRDILRRVRSFCVERGVIFVSPFLLSDEAKSLLSVLEDKTNFVKDVNGRGYYDGCKTVDQELDLEFFIHTLTKDQGKYITIQRGKYRSPKLIPEDQLYFAGFDREAVKDLIKTHSTIG